MNSELYPASSGAETQLEQFQYFHDLLNYACCANYLPKREWIRSNVLNKKVLDLGVVGHSVERYLNQPDQWLHKIIKDHASYVIGVDILAEDVKALTKLGFNIIVEDALTVRLNEKFDVIVCGDLIEHVNSPHALLETVEYHLITDGRALISTPNPFAATRFFNILADGWTGINLEHVCWICPQTMHQLVGRTNLKIVDFVWLETDFPSLTRHRYWKNILNPIASLLSRKRQVLHNDYGVVLQKRQ